MPARRRSASDLPRAPLELTHPFVLQGGAVTGAELLADAPGPRAVELLRVYRLALAWTAGGGEPDRDAVLRLEARFLSRLDLDPLAAPLAVLAAALLDPAGADRSRVARACICVAEWAVGKEASRTALAFTQLAALASPRQARFAWMAARLLFSQGRLREAETWYRRAHRVAVWTDDWEAQARALNSLGLDNFERGRFPVAKRYYLQAIRVARRHREREIEGIATHNLFVVLSESGEGADAERYAMRTYELYGPDHPRLPELVTDFALAWNRQGYYQRTLPIFLALKVRSQDPSDRVRIAAGITRAAGGSGNHRAFIESWNEIWELFEQVPSAKLAAGALFEAAIGAANLGEMEMAGRALTRALEIASRSDASDTASQAELALARIARGENPDPAPERRRAVSSGRPADALAQEFVQSLTPEPVHSA